MSCPSRQEIDDFLRQLHSEAPREKRGFLEIVDLVRVRFGGAWVNMDVDVHLSLDRIKCARARCSNVGTHPHRDLMRLYCVHCARLINKVNGVALFTCPDGCDHRNAGCVFSCYEEDE